MKVETGEIKHFFENRGDVSKPRFEPVNISFVNTSLFTEAANHFRKYGDYEYPIPKDFTPNGNYERWVRKFREGTLPKDVINYWKQEDHRMKYGMTAPGQFKNGRIEEVSITGLHYTYLNYMPIMRLAEGSEDESSEEIIQRKLGRKKHKDFPAFWDGDFYLYHAKELAWELEKHFIYCKARRKGASHKEAAEAAYTMHTVPNSITVLAAYQSKYLYAKGRGLFVIAKEYLDFMNQYTIWRKGYSKSRADGSGVQFGRKTKTGEVLGFGSQMYALSFHDNPDAGIGEDIYRLKVEEAGKFPNLEATLDVMLPALEDGSVITGQASIYGTAGTKDANWEYFEKISYNPELIRALSFENVWDDDALGTDSAYFFAYTQNLVPFIDAYGNSEKDLAKSFSENDRKEKNANSSPEQYKAYCAQHANNFQEAFSHVDSSILPKTLAREQRLKVEKHPEIMNMIKVGQLFKTDKGVKLIRNDQLSKSEQHPAIFQYPHKDDDDLHGAIVEWFTPHVDTRTNTIPVGLYGIWVDPYGVINDGSQKGKKLSLGSIYVFENGNLETSTLGNRIVASFIGRGNQHDPDSFNEIVYLLAERYNALGSVLVENNRGNVKDYFTKIKKLHYLMVTPNFQLPNEMSFTNTQKYGLTLTVQLKDIAMLYFKKWLEEEVGIDEQGRSILRIHTIYDIGLLAEIEKYDGKRNADRISACLIGMFQKEQSKYNIIRKPKEQTKSFFSSATIRDKARSGQVSNMELSKLIKTISKQGIK